MRRFAGIMLLCLALAAPAAAQRIRVDEVPTRPGQTVRALSIQPAERVAAGVVILLPDGPGNLGLTPAGRFAAGEQDPLVRARLMLARAGLVVVVPDIAPDLKQGTGVIGGYRTGEAHAADLGALIRHYRRFGGPVALAGTGRAGLSIASAAVRLTGPARPDALIFVSAHLADSGLDEASVQRGVAGLEKIDRPVLLIAHQADGCRLSPPGALPRVRGFLPNAAPFDTRILTGGRSTSTPDHCTSSAPHGLPGLEQELADTIAAWLKSLPRR